VILEKLSLINYKNIAEATLELSPKINCFIGHNGVGKTNVLDAVYYLSFCHSASTPIDSQVIRHGEEFLMLEGRYDGDLAISCGMKRGQKKHFKRNGKEYKRLSEHIGLVPIVMVSPGDIFLIEGGSEERRRLMDVVIAQTDCAYMEALVRYNKALQQRNSLLKQEEEPDEMMMCILEEQMATAGEDIFRHRSHLTEALVPQFQDLYRRISGGHEMVALRYVSHCQRGPLLEVIRSSRWKDRAVGYSLHGIHRDDLEILLDDHPMKREGSQGQQKTFVIALKLAQFSLLARQEQALKAEWLSPCGKPRRPILLLDDIFDKLDARRVEQIVEMVSGNEFGQIFITDTNREHLDQILTASSHDYKLFRVEDGEVEG
jgi:DNA replication and repair protein RecF